MPLTSVIALLQATVAFLTAVQAIPNISPQYRDQVTQSVQVIITQANQALANSSQTSYTQPGYGTINYGSDNGSYVPPQQPSQYFNAGNSSHTCGPASNRPTCPSDQHLMTTYCGSGAVKYQCATGASNYGYACADTAINCPQGQYAVYGRTSLCSQECLTYIP